jgi:6-phosphogluconolactonase
MPSHPDIRIADNQAWAHEAAMLLHQLSEQSIAATGRCLMALSGGSTPVALYQTLTAPEWKHKFRWQQMEFVFGDERCVPPDHPESNFGAARRSLFLPLEIDPTRIHRMKGETTDPSTAALEYEHILRTLTASPPPAFPKIDLILLGLGDDGHTASLFPGSPALSDNVRAVAVTQSPKGVSLRLTLTLGVINRATVVLFLVSGPGKAPMARTVLDPMHADRRLPAAMVQPQAGRVIWMLDRSAASELPDTMH